MSEVSKQKLNNIFFSKINIYKSINSGKLITNELYKCIIFKRDGTKHIKYYINEKQIPMDTMIEWVQWKVFENFKNLNNVEIEIIESKKINDMEEFNKFILNNFIKEGRMFKIID
jgi:hypothetical protein